MQTIHAIWNGTPSGKLHLWAECSDLQEAALEKSSQEESTMTENRLHVTDEHFISDMKTFQEKVTRA